MATTAADPLARKPFGQTGLSVPPVAVGCAPIGNMPEAFAYGVTEEDALATIRAALDSPIPYIDTAALYGDGESERRVGLVLRERGGLPANAFLQTKQGRNPKNDDYSGETVKRRMERSLELLGVDRIEVVYLHDQEWTTFEDAMAPGGPSRGPPAVPRPGRHRSPRRRGWTDSRADPVHRNRALRCGDPPQPLHPAQPLGGPTHRRGSRPRHGGAQRGALRQRHAGQRPRRLSRATPINRRPPR